jgi:hypothetical protein
MSKSSSESGASGSSKAGDADTGDADTDDAAAGDAAAKGVAAGDETTSGATIGGATNAGATHEDATPEDVTPCGAAAADAATCGVLAGASGADEPGALDTAATRATRAAIAPVLLVPVPDVEAACDVVVPAPDVGCEVDPRPDVDALLALDAGDVEELIDELPGTAGRGGGFAAGGGDAAGAGRAGGTVGIANFEGGLLTVAARALALVPDVAEADGFLAAATDAVVCAPAEPAAGAGPPPGAAGDAEADVALTCRALGVGEATRAADAGPAEVAEDLAAIVPG